MAPMPDEAAFADFVTTWTAALMRTAYLLTRDHHLAEDLVQTALFKAAMAWERIEGEPEPYVRRILYTENISWWRRRRRRVPGATIRAEEPAGPGTDVDLQCPSSTPSTCSRRSNARSWRCATTRTSPRPRQPASSASRWAP